MRVRVRYAKTGKLRFVSAIDLGRIWERSLRRADLPIAYSEGFSPHPKVSFPDALPLGYASTGEYAELTFAAPVDVGGVMADLNRSFPAGMRVLAAAAVDEGDPRLAKWLRASTWDLSYPEEAARSLAAAVLGARAARHLPVDRDRKGEISHIDVRPAVHQLSVLGSTVRATVHHTEPPTRPSELHPALDQCAAPDGGPLPQPLLVTRVAQGRPTGEGLIEAISGEILGPLEPISERVTHP